MRELICTYPPAGHADCLGHLGVNDGQFKWGSPPQVLDKLKCMCTRWRMSNGIPIMQSTRLMDPLDKVTLTNEIIWRMGQYGSTIN